MREAPKLVPCLWYTDKAEEAAAFHASILPNSKVDSFAGGCPTATGLCWQITPSALGEMMKDARSQPRQAARRDEPMTAGPALVPARNVFLFLQKRPGGSQ
jgi:predicted 3-demethylubiquinone-9 3-methyltransferase (glyoxalase superfamily)